MNCTSCHAQLETRARFCPICGTPVHNAGQESTGLSSSSPALEHPSVPPTEDVSASVPSVQLPVAAKEDVLPLVPSAQPPVEAKEEGIVAKDEDAPIDAPPLVPETPPLSPAEEDARPDENGEPVSLPVPDPAIASGIERTPDTAQPVTPPSFQDETSAPALLETERLQRKKSVRSLSSGTSTPARQARNAMRVPARPAAQGLETTGNDSPALSKHTDKPMHVPSPRLPELPQTPAAEPLRPQLPSTQEPQAREKVQLTPPVPAMLQPEKQGASSFIEKQETQPIPLVAAVGLQPWGLPPQPDLLTPRSSQTALSPSKPSQPLLYYRLNKLDRGSQMLPAVVNTSPRTRLVRRRRGGCLLSFLLFLVIVGALLGAVWFLGVRPYVHDFALNQLNKALDSAVNQVTPIPGPIPQTTETIKNVTIDNLLTLGLAPSDPVQKPVTHITPNNVRIDFQLAQYGFSFPCAVTLVPKIENGQLVARNVTIEGVIGLIISADDLTTILNNHLAAAQKRLQHNVTAIQLKDGSADLTVS